jgi:hypothetical protein
MTRCPFYYFKQKFAEKVSLYKNMLITLVTRKIATFCRKLAEIAKNRDHNPWCRF